MTQRESSRPNGASEAAILDRFARDARPTIIAVLSKLRAREPRPALQRLRRYVLAVTSSVLVRSAVGVGVVSAFVMLVGVGLFKVDQKQAFLTWFTVTFGALSLSVGVTSVRLRHGHELAAGDDSDVDT